MEGKHLHDEDVGDDNDDHDEYGDDEDDGDNGKHNDDIKDVSNCNDHDGNGSQTWYDDDDDKYSQRDYFPFHVLF